MKTKIFCLLIVVLITAGCSGGKGISLGNPILPENEIASSNEISSMGILGTYELIIDAENFTADLIPKRDASLGESMMVSAKSFFVTQPCRDCLRISELGLQDENIVVKSETGNQREPKKWNQPNESMWRIRAPDFTNARCLEQENTGTE